MVASCKFRGEGHQESIQLMAECPALAFEHLGVLYVLQFRNPPLDLSSFIRLIQVGHIGRAMVWRAERLEHTGGSPCQTP